MMAIVVKGDALIPADVERAFAAIDGVDAVVSTIGGTTADPAADSLGNINLIEAALRHGVKKFVLVTSIGTGDSRCVCVCATSLSRGDLEVQNLASGDAGTHLRRPAAPPREDQTPSPTRAAAGARRRRKSTRFSSQCCWRKKRRRTGSR